MCLTSRLTIKLLLLTVLHVVAARQNKFRIVGGTTTTISRAKYIVTLRTTDGEFFCGGSLVASTYVVTAAHCVKGKKTSEFNVHGGATFLFQSGIKRSILQITLPKAFNDRNNIMDVAVLKLAQPMVGINIAPIPLCSHKLYVGDEVNVSGWGLPAENALRPSAQLRTVKVKMISQRTCRNGYRNVAKITSTMMCASVPGKKDACSGDSGGPLTYRGQLCGIVSFGRGCAQKQYPGVYTIVNRVKRFIKRAMTT